MNIEMYLQNPKLFLEELPNLDIKDIKKEIKFFRSGVENVKNLKEKELPEIDKAIKILNSNMLLTKKGESDLNPKFIQKEINKNEDIKKILELGLRIANYQLSQLTQMEEMIEKFKK